MKEAKASIDDAPHAGGRGERAPEGGVARREQFDAWCERAVLALVLAVLVFSPLALGSVELRQFFVVEWLAVAILAVWFCRFAINPKHRLLWPPLNWAVLAFVIYAVFRYATADIEYVARQELMRVLVYAVVFFAVLHNLHRQETTQLVGMTLLGVATFLAFYGLYQNLTGSNFVWNLERPDGYLKRGSGTFICPNHLAGYLGMLLPLALACTLTGRFSVLTKVFTGYAAFAIFAGTLVTFSRGGWVATGLGVLALLVWLVTQRGYRLQAVMVLTALALLAAFLWVNAKMSPSRFEQIVVRAEKEDLRFNLWGAAATMWRDHVWWGVGPGHFDYRFPQYRVEDWKVQVRPDKVHNDYLNLLADWGLAGGLLVSGIFGVFYWQVARSWRYVQRAQSDLKTKRSNKSAFVMGGAVGLMAMLLHAAIDFNMQIPANAILAVTLLALVAGHFRFTSERFWHTVRWPLRIPVTLVLAAALAYLGWQSWRAASEVRWLARARAATYGSDQQIDFLTRAFAADPQNFETAYKIGEVLRRKSFTSPENYQALAQRAIRWFKISAQLNPFDPLPHLRAGMCYDWIDDHAAALNAMDRGRELDPNGYFTRALLGWHFFQVADYDKAKEWLLASLKVKGTENPIATSYLRFTEAKLAERAAKK